MPDGRWVTAPRVTSRSEQSSGRLLPLRVVPWPVQPVVGLVGGLDEEWQVLAGEARAVLPLALLVLVEPGKAHRVPGLPLRLVRPDGGPDAADFHLVDRCVL